MGDMRKLSIFKDLRRRFRNPSLQLSRRAFTLLFAVGVGLALAIAACSPSSSGSSSVTPAPPPTVNRVLHLGHQKFDPFTLVKARGGLEQRLQSLGVTVEWTEFQAGPPMLEALNAGSIDIARTGDAPPVIAQAAGTPLVYIGGSAPKDRSSALIVKPNSPIQAIADLRGKKVAYAKGSSANYLIVRILESGGLTLEDIESVYLSPADARSAFEQGSVDAWVIWDPFYAAAQEQANARVIRDSEGLVSNRDFYLAAQSYVSDNADVIAAIAEEVKQVSIWADRHPEEVVEILSPILKIEPPILEVVTRRRNYGFEPIDSVMIAEQQAIADTFYKLKLIPQPIKVADAVWQSPS